MRTALHQAVVPIGKLPVAERERQQTGRTPHLVAMRPTLWVLLLALGCTDDRLLDLAHAEEPGTTEPEEPRCFSAHPCRLAAFDRQAGRCVEQNVADGTGCDGSACLAGAVCVDGECRGSAVACDDGDPCTLDTCYPEQGCRQLGPVSACPAPEDPCALPTCDPVVGCGQAPAPDGTACVAAAVRTAGVCRGGILVSPRSHGTTVSPPAGLDAGLAARLRRCGPTIRRQREIDLNFGALADREGNLFWWERSESGCSFVSMRIDGTERFALRAHARPNIARCCCAASWCCSWRERALPPAIRMTVVQPGFWSRVRPRGVLEVRKPWLHRATRCSLSGRKPAPTRTACGASTCSPASLWRRGCSGSNIRQARSRRAGRRCLPSWVTQRGTLRAVRQWTSRRRARLFGVRRHDAVAARKRAGSVLLARRSGWRTACTYSGSSGVDYWGAGVVRGADGEPLPSLGKAISGDNRTEPIGAGFAIEPAGRFWSTTGHALALYEDNDVVWAYGGCSLGICYLSKSPILTGSGTLLLLGADTWLDQLTVSEVGADGQVKRTCALEPGAWTPGPFVLHDGTLVAPLVEDQRTVGVAAWRLPGLSEAESGWTSPGGGPARGGAPH